MRKFVFIAIISISLLVIYYVPFNNTKYLTNWGITIPTDFKEIYHISSDLGFHGDGWRYNVYNPKNKTHLPFFNGFQKSSDKDVEVFVKNCLNKLEADKNYFPLFNQEYLWWMERRSDNTLVIIYSPYTGYYYFVQEFI